MELFRTILLILSHCFLAHAQDAGSRAEIQNSITNDSVIIGNNAIFKCEIEGNQDISETLTFSKIEPDAFVISVNDELIHDDDDKYDIRDNYELKIRDVQIEDEGAYECSFAGTNYIGYLTVSDPPSNADIYWNEGYTWTPMFEPSNLTCYSSKSYPPASFRWYRGSTSLTRDAVRVVDEDSYGYGRAWSYLEMFPTRNDEGDIITCYIDMPHKDAYYTQTMEISFSGSSQAFPSLFAVLLFVLHTL